MTDLCTGVDCIHELRSDLSLSIIGITCSYLAIIGLMLNILGLCVFRRMERTDLFTKLIISLIIVDSSVLIMSFGDVIVIGFKVRDKFLSQIYAYVTYPCFYIFVCSSIYLTICIAYERYSALKDPVRYSNGSESCRNTQFRK